MTKVLIVPDKFKSTLSSREVADSLATGIRQTCPRAELSSLVVSDGGEGFLEAVAQSEKMELHRVRLPGPGGRLHTGSVGVSPKSRSVYLESCQATGFHLLDRKKRNPLKVSSEGLADLMQAALAFRPRNLYIGLGSSATCDAGIPVAGRFGFEFLDAKKRKITPKAKNLGRIQTILAPDLKSIIPGRTRIFAVADVVNPPVGKKGGVKVYAPQKGASPREVTRLENGMQKLLRAMKKSGGKGLSSLPSGGAAGCLALGLHYFFGAKIIRGAPFVFEKLGLEKKIQASDIVITGEGSFDEQSFFGKITGNIIRTGRKHKKRIILVTGRTKVPGFLKKQVAAVLSVEQLLDKEDRSGKKESRAALTEHGRRIGELISRK